MPKDDDDADLVEALLTRVGMIMEDASIIALSSGSGDRSFRIVRLTEAVNSMAAFIAAAEFIQTR